MKYPITSIISLALILTSQSVLCFKLGYKKAEENIVPEKVIQYVYIEKEQPKEEQPQTETPKNEIQNVSLGTFIATAYCPCQKCCGKYALNRPIDDNGEPIIYTASGEVAKDGITVAVDPSIIPLGTKLCIGGKEYIATDTGSAIKGNRIDFYFADHEQALQFGRQQVEVFVMR